MIQYDGIYFCWNNKMKLYKFFIMVLVVVSTSSLLIGCNDEKVSSRACSRVQYAYDANILKVANDFINSANFKSGTNFEFAKIKKASPLYYIVCYSVTEDGRNYQAGVHVIKRDGNWKVFNVTMNWEAVQ